MARHHFCWSASAMVRSGLRGHGREWRWQVASRGLRWQRGRRAVQQAGSRELSAGSDSCQQIDRCIVQRLSRPRWVLIITEDRCGSLG